MLKLCVLALFLGAAFADEPYHVAEFRADLETFKGEVNKAANEIEKVEGMALAAFTDPTGSQLPALEEAFKNMLESVGETFNQEEERMVQVISKLWEDPGDFVENDLCDSTANVMSSPGADEQAIAIALMEDMGCFKASFRTVNYIDTDAMVAGSYTEHEALEVIAGGFIQMHKVKMAGERFCEAVQEMDGAPADKKRELTRLLRLLTKLSKK